MLRRQLGGVELPPVVEAKAIETLKTKLPKAEDYAALSLMATQIPPLMATSNSSGDVPRLVEG